MTNATDKLSGGQWTTQVTEVTLSETYEHGEKQIHGAKVKAVHRYEYNGVNYSGDPEVKKNAVSTEFFVPATHVLPQVGDVLVFQYETASQGMAASLPALPLLDGAAALEAGDDE